jgi:FAD/FMN-containing dehydrogenase
VKSLQIVLADGEVLEVGDEPVPPGPASLSESPPGPEARKRELVSRLADLLSREAALIRRQQPKSLVNTCGYNLVDVLHNGHLDVARLLSGSEGTLALITEATLGIQPLARHRGLCVLLFDRLDSALRAVQEIIPLGPSACDLMDRRHLSLARETDPR